ncbi:short chain alcohol dehydrogenase [Paraphaeosphaeria sporulosa]|uniref:Short chain alcohol dehydrogenase n=1 Tax=Paraphaeosphaeria sporulosa TaxID=1460663 RepID=A0A177C2L1_9PLEO|nr:short chain alcohol dehydrogenase [Paraphaeosphaeria sporulosa]OAG01883.1 short chain alcohol dehydrogenase [Paraphaeosphaeria sporulosa]
MEINPAEPSASRNIIVSGGAQGIGRALGRYFLEAGHRIFIFDIQEEELEYTATKHLEKYHKDGKVGYAVCNLRNVDAIRSKVDEAAKFFGGQIDVLVNNGGIASPHWKDNKTMEDKETYDQWLAYMETNLTAPFAMSQACIPFMKHRESESHNSLGAHKHVAGPCIIHIGSFRAHQSDLNQEGYAASKAGQLGLMQAMSVSLGPLGIRTNLVAPGRIKVGHESKEGDEHGHTWEGQNTEKDIDDHTTNRAGRPKDIADACLYLINAGFVNGVDITVDGGALRKKAA